MAGHTEIHTVQICVLSFSLFVLYENNNKQEILSNFLTPKG